MAAPATGADPTFLLDDAAAAGCDEQDMAPSACTREAALRDALTTPPFVTCSDKRTRRAVATPSHMRHRHACFLVPGPPNLGLSQQFRHAPQLLRRQPSHLPRWFCLRLASMDVRRRFGSWFARASSSSIVSHSPRYRCWSVVPRNNEEEVGAELEVIASKVRFCTRCCPSTALMRRATHCSIARRSAAS